MRRRKLVVGLVVVAIVVVAVGLFFALGDKARPVTIDEAKQRATSSVPPDDSPATRRPKPGVYSYVGSGTESLSVPPLSQEQGPEMPGTVEWGQDGCWTFRIDFSSNHWQAWTHCPEGDDLVEAGGQSWQRWMIGATAITNLSDFKCDAGAMLIPANPKAGDEWKARCVGTNEAVDGEAVSAGTYRFIGTEDLKVGDKTISTHRFLRERTMSGAQVGTERSEVWFAVDTGLPVRNERTVEARTSTPIGESTYTETGEFHLESIEPA
ncbi:MAG: hypothetical protein KDB26_01450 [Microthrixaceae bacterium]|nr:hypothetical protein [Microthrixaceae bacterium]